MTYEIPFRAIRVTSRELEGQPKVADAVGWLMSNREAGDTYSVSFDMVVSRFNNVWLGDYPPSCTNITNLKGILGESRLPTLKEIFNACGKPIPADRYRKVLHTINEMMNTGDLRESDLDHFGNLPYLGYQKSAPSDEDVFVGSLFHFYEEWIVADHMYGLRDRRDIVVNALVETLSDDRENVLWNAVALPDRLDWIRGYNEGFTPEFQEFAGFPPGTPPALPQ